MKTYVIAEIGVNHNGCYEEALELIDCAARAGASAVKFQTFSAEHLVTMGAKKMKYQARETKSKTQFEMLKNLQLSEYEHIKLREYSNNKGLEFLSTPFDEISLNMLIKIGVEKIKISSADITNFLLIKAISKYKKPIIMSTAASTLDEVMSAIDFIRKKSFEWHGANYEHQITLLHCVGVYPASDEDQNLNAMITLRNSTGLDVGLSDHSINKFVPVVAVALGAKIIEKHITRNKTALGPDHAASLNEKEFQQMVESIKITESILGTGIKAPTRTEAEYIEKSRRGLYFNKNIEAGKFIGQGDLIALRPFNGMTPSFFEKVVGRKLKKRAIKNYSVNLDYFED